MGKRNGVSASLRWSVFARDGFCCRYCGAQAGEEGVELAVDHVVSVKEGGDNRLDNLVTACRSCNGGKGARSLSAAPAPEEVIERVRRRAKSLADLAEAMALARRNEEALAQEIVNLKCAAYEVRSVNIAEGEMAAAIRLCREFGADLVAEWYFAAAQQNVRAWEAIRYVCGCARRTRERAAMTGGAA